MLVSACFESYDSTIIKTSSCLVAKIIDDLRSIWNSLPVLFLSTGLSEAEYEIQTV